MRPRERGRAIMNGKRILSAAGALALAATGLCGEAQGVTAELGYVKLRARLRAARQKLEI